jgi:hypothetical protein
MTKTEFIDRLALAASRAKDLQEKVDPARGVLPSDYVFTIFHGGQPGEQKVKFLGGRLLAREDLRALSLARAGSMLWVDGKIPSWINVSVESAEPGRTEILIMYSRDLVEADAELFPDYGMEKGNELAPFRIRGRSCS